MNVPLRDELRYSTINHNTITCWDLSREMPSLLAAAGAWDTQPSQSEIVSGAALTPQTKSQRNQTQPQKAEAELAHLAHGQRVFFRQIGARHR